MDSLEAWIERQYPYAAVKMQMSISPVGVVHRRPGFGQTLRPKPGAVVASPIPGAYDPDPDYFFHWFRDSAVVMDALRLMRDDATLAPRAMTQFAEFVRFSLNLLTLDGRTLLRSNGWRRDVALSFQQYLRADAELGEVHGPAIVAETRVNPDGTLDISKWARPQHDGPSLQALMLMQWLTAGALERDVERDAETLLRFNVEFALQHARQPCFDLWEEELGWHYYTVCVGAAALSRAGNWFAGKDTNLADACRAEATHLRQRLDAFWLPSGGFYRSRMLDGSAPSTKELDIAVIFASIHGPASATAHSPQDPRIHATLDALEQQFRSLYAINRALPSDRGAAMGRYQGDVYFSGGAYYFSTLAAAECCYRAAAGSGESARWLARGDGFLRTVQTYTPASGEMSEQFDQTDGAQTSAKHLAWSYAGLISAVHARRALMA